MCKWSLHQAFISDCDTSIQTICLNYVGVVKFINVTSWQWGSGSELTNILFFIICARCALKKIDDLYNSCIKRFCLLSSSKETSSQFPLFWRKNLKVEPRLRAAGGKTFSGHHLPFRNEPPTFAKKRFCSEEDWTRLRRESYQKVDARYTCQASMDTKCTLCTDVLLHDKPRFSWYIFYQDRSSGPCFQSSSDVLSHLQPVAARTTVMLQRLFHVSKSKSNKLTFQGELRSTSQWRQAPRNLLHLDQKSSSLL